MSKKIRISGEEREFLIRGENETFPKYTTQFLNLANQNAQSTRERFVGNMQDIIKDFENNHPNGTYDDWIEFYKNEYNGDQNLEQSADRLYEMVEDMREAIEEIDREMSFRFVRELVLYKTYMGENLDVKEAILEKLSILYDKEIERTHDSWITAYLGEVPIVFQSEDSNAFESPGKDVAVVYYRVNKSTNSIEIDPYELNEKLGTTITDEDKVHRSLDEFTLSLVSLH